MIKKIYICDYCREEIGNTNSMINISLSPTDFVDFLVEDTTIHFHDSECHLAYFKLVDKAREKAKKYFERFLENILEGLCQS